MLPYHQHMHTSGASSDKVCTTKSRSSTTRITPCSRKTAVREEQKEKESERKAQLQERWMACATEARAPASCAQLSGQQLLTGASAEGGGGGGTSR